jgi:hypothetical protein
MISAKDLFLALPKPLRIVVIVLVMAAVGWAAYVTHLYLAMLK